ncbi:MAG: hypothetical protein OEZ01_17990 [Candidatus Heimdallarchaeota archaeon]|nr:hypothetical protein [Candidatus Heimdallarchaeota archaeon]
MIPAIKKNSKIFYGISGLLFIMAIYKIVAIWIIPNLNQTDTSAENEYMFYGAESIGLIILVLILVVAILMIIGKKFANYQWLFQVGNVVVIVIGLYFIFWQSSWRTPERIAEIEIEAVKKETAKKAQTESQNRQNLLVTKLVWAYKTMNNTDVYSRSKLDSSFHILRGAGINIKQNKFTLKPGVWTTNHDPIGKMYKPRNSFVDKNGNYPDVTYFGFTDPDCGDYDCAFASRVQNEINTNDKKKAVLVKAPYYYYKNMGNKDAVFYLYIWEPASVPTKIRKLAGQETKTTISLSLSLTKN